MEIFHLIYEKQRTAEGISGARKGMSEKSVTDETDAALSLN